MATVLGDGVRRSAVGLELEHETLERVQDVHGPASSGLGLGIGEAVAGSFPAVHGSGLGGAHAASAISAIMRPLSCWGREARSVSQ